MTTNQEYELPRACLLLETRISNEIAIRNLGQHAHRLSAPSLDAITYSAFSCPPPQSHAQIQPPQGPWQKEMGSRNHAVKLPTSMLFSSRMKHPVHDMPATRACQSHGLFRLPSTPILQTREAPTVANLSRSRMEHGCISHMRLSLRSEAMASAC